MASSSANNNCLNIQMDTSSNRSKNSYALTPYDFEKNILVVCPNCGQQALANRVPRDKTNTRAYFKVTCPHCAYTKNMYSSSLKVPLWLSVLFEGNMIWAYNYEHLALLKKHVEATLRERNNYPNRNGSIGSRIPRWMSSAKNRKKVLKYIEKLQRGG